MTNKEKGIAYLKQLDVINAVIDEFDKNDLVNCSYEPRGILYWADSKQRETIIKLENEFDGTRVWHIIKGTYFVDKDTDETMDATIYLLATDDDENELQHYEDDYYAFAYVQNDTYDYLSEYGDVVISPRNGGISRVF